MKQELLAKLQNIIKDMSVNSLRSVYPERVFQWLNISQREFKDFMKELHDERLITYKYTVPCSCGNSGTVYLRKVNKEPYICVECGREYEKEEVIKKGILLCEISKKDIMKYEDSNGDFKEEALINDKIIYLEQDKFGKDKKEKMREIFLGSSSEAIQDMQDIGYILEDMGNKVLPWNAAGKNIFPANENTIDSLIAITKRVQAAVFIFSAEDKIWHHKSLKKTATVRDNVLFEYGLFCGALDKKNVCFICKGNPSLASDLDGVTYIDGDKGDMTIRKRLEDWINVM